MKKITTFLFILVCLKSFSQADKRSSFSRTSFWTETVLNGAIKGKFKWQLDYQYRRQSDASDVLNPNKNMFANSFQHVYRPWIHYQFKDNIRFSLSPLGFWETLIPAKEAAGKQKIQPEFRICPQITLSNKYGRVTIDQRYRFEYRFLGTKVENVKNSEFAYSLGAEFRSANEKMRFRYFIRAIVPLGKHKKLEEKTFYIIAWNEMFIGASKHTNNDKIWDQNRTFCLLGYKPKMKIPMRFEAGYGLQYANRFVSTISNGTFVETGNTIEKNNLFQVYIIFEDFNKLFHLKKP